MLRHIKASNTGTTWKAAFQSKILYYVLSLNSFSASHSAQQSEAAVNESCIQRQELSHK